MNAENVYIKGADFAECEKAALELGVSQYAPERITMLLRETYNRVKNSGSTRISLDGFIKSVWWLENKIGCFHRTPLLLIGQELLEHYHIQDDFVYSKSMYWAERMIAQRIHALIQKRPRLHIYSDDIDQIEKKLNIRYDETQREAFSLINHGIGILTGGPGTGKTTVLKGIINAAEDKGKNVICCAPTGKAAERMREATGHYSSTIHQALGIRPFDDGAELSDVFYENSLVICDEVSMVDTEIFDLLTKAVMSANCTLLLVGDEDQLPSVGAGNVLHDLMEYEKIPLVRLTTVHRQDNGSAITENANRIKDGDFELKADGRTYFQKMYLDSEKLVKDACNCYVKANKTAPGEIRIYTPIRDPNYPTSTAVINATLHNYFHKNDASLTANGQIFSPGDPVVITKNDYEEGILNGDEGVIESVSDGLQVRINGKFHDLTGEQLQHVDLAYAVTVHKAQGSSCKAAIIIVPEKPVCLLTRQLLYVAVTRAEKQAVVLYEGDSLVKSICNVYKKTRNTGLQDRLGVKNEEKYKGAA